MALNDLHTDYVPVGHSTNLGSRMEQLVNPGTIVVSAYTHRLTDGYFSFKEIGPTQIKGVEEPLIFMGSVSGRYPRDCRCLPVGD